MTASQASIFNFNVFDIFVNIVPGILLIISLMQLIAVEVPLNFSNDLSGFFALLIAGYILGHALQRASERVFREVFGFPNGLETNLKRKGVSEIKSEYINREACEKNDVCEADAAEIDRWLSTKPESVGFQSLEAKLIDILESEYAMSKSVQRISSGNAGEVFQICFSHSVNHAGSRRVERFFATANLFRSLSFLSVFLLMFSIALYVSDLLGFGLLTGVVNSNVRIPTELSATEILPPVVLGMLLLIAAYTFYDIYTQYRKYLIRSLISDFVSSHYVSKTD